MPGQFVFGRFKAEEELSIDGSIIYKWIKKFTGDEYEMITIESNNQYSIITICNWEEYQGRDSDEVTTKEQPSSNQIAATGQPRNTNNKEKKEKKDKKDKNNKSEIKISEDATQMNLELFPTKLKETKATDNVEDYLSKIVSQFCESFQVFRSIPYEIMNPGKERASAAKILKAFKKQCPDTNLNETLIGLRTYFDQCININDPWFFDHMSLQLIVSQFTQINNFLRHGNKRKTNSKGATGQELAAITTKHFAK